MFLRKNHLLSSGADHWAAGMPVDLKPMLNVIVVLIPMLLLSAEFAKKSIIETTPFSGESNTNTPSSEQARPKIANLNATVLVSDTTVTLANRNGILPSIYFTPKNIQNAIDTLKQRLTQLKQRFADAPDNNEVTIAATGRIKYETIVHIMDAVREAGFVSIAIAKWH
ncbi:MAG: biopolymer transporter ExbD [Chitinivibrionales bacterium]|nr:biopolymer transporter ExbD [Chitinivibrionales bacterium]